LHRQLKSTFFTAAGVVGFCIENVPAFEKAITKSIPDSNLVSGLEKRNKDGEKELKIIRKKWEKPVILALEKLLPKKLSVAENKVC
jgi:hypothetical protein